jgi:RNA polymerase sigma-70 factor (ECF subfamily)
VGAPSATLKLVAPDASAPGPAEVRFEDVFRTYSAYVARVALRLLGRDDEVDDVVQDSFLAAHRGLKNLRDPAGMRGWLATVTVRVCRRKLRLRRMWSMVGLEDAGAHLPSREASPEARALLVHLYSLLDRLPADERIAWVLRHVEGEQLEAVARLCGCSLATAKRRIAAAQARLEQELGHE